MKKVLVSIIAMFFLATSLNAQQVGYVNTAKILEKMPEYASAKAQLDDIKSKYDLIVSSEYKKIEILYSSYQSQKSMLSEPEKAARENEIIVKEKSVKDLQKSYFGPEGDLAKKSSELLDPIKEKVNAAVKSVAEELKIIIIFDISAVQGVIYSSPAADFTPYVLKKLNLQETNN